MEKVRVGIIGCGTISAIYLKNLTTVFKSAEVVACADLLRDRAEARATEFNIPRAMSVEELLDDAGVQLVVNLTIPASHAEVSERALFAGKCVYGEKPLATTREDGKRVNDLAARAKLLVGSAPDTFLGAGLQTCRKLLDDGWIGRPVAATAFVLGHGHESWHPSPAFYYQKGGGPLFDMGPYYLTALVSLLGPVARVTGSAQMSFTERTVTSEPLRGQRISVEVPTHVAGVLDFAGGAVATLITSFDVWSHHLPRIEIYGSEGSLSVPDPNTFGGPVFIRRRGQEEWREVPLMSDYTQNSRGIGVADMARALRDRGTHRANGSLAYHVLDVMQGLYDASATGRHYRVESTCDRPEPFDPSVEL